MGNGRNADGDNGAPGTLGERLRKDIVERATLVIISVALGIGGNTALQKTSAEVRKDPFTGTQGRAMQQDHDSDIREARAERRELEHLIAENAASVKVLAEVLGHVQRDHERVMLHVETHERESGSWKRRIERNEYRLDTLEETK